MFPILCDIINYLYRKGAILFIDPVSLVFLKYLKDYKI